MFDSDCSYHYSDDDFDRAKGDVLISSLGDVHRVMRIPKKYGGISVHYLLLQCIRSDGGDEKMCKDQCLILVGNIRRLQ